MQYRVREYLIDKARQERPVPYEDVNKDCRLGLDLNQSADRNTLAGILGDISQYEHQAGRPLLSSMAVYKGVGDHGNGFYELCESMGLGKAARLKQQLYAFEQMAESIKFWRDDTNYQRHRDTDDDNDDTEVVVEDNSDLWPVFFTSEELSYFTRYGSIVYNMHNPDHVQAKNILMDTVYAKTQFWTEQVGAALVGFGTKANRVWQNPGWDNSTGESVQVNKIKHYTWGKVFKAAASDIGVYFTVGVDVSTQELVYKLDYEHNSRSKQLTEEQKRLCGELIPNELRWVGIPFAQLHTYYWGQLIDEVVQFIADNLDTYESIITSVRSGVINVPKLKNILIPRDLPTTGHAEIPPRIFEFKGLDVDWIQKHQDDTALGNAGEGLVIFYERGYLVSKGRPDLAEQVCKVKDGYGYDINSYYEDGSPKHIEVKTTTGDYNNQFDITINEITYSRLQHQQYQLYRLFNYNWHNNTAEVHIYDGALDDHFHFESVGFLAYRR